MIIIRFFIIIIIIILFECKAEKQNENKKNENYNSAAILFSNHQVNDVSFLFVLALDMKQDHLK